MLPLTTPLLPMLAGAVLAVLAAVTAWVWLQVRRVRYIEPRMQALSPLEVPEVARDILAPGLELLLEMGFAKPAAQRVVSQLAAGLPRVQYLLVLTHTQLPAAAFVSTLAAADGPRSWTIQFASRTRDGRTLVTRNRASEQGPLPLRDVVTNDVWLPDWPAVWKAHRARMRALGAKSSQWAGLSAAAWARASAEADTAIWQVRLMHRQLVAARKGGFKVGFRWAAAIVARSWLVMNHRWRAMAADRKASLLAPPPKAAAQAAVYEQQCEEHPQGGWRTGLRWLLGLAAVGAGAHAFGLEPGLPAAVALLLVWLLHESGHALAMALLRVREPAIFMLPSLGLALRGRARAATPAQELVVLLAGPLPGLVAGVMALLYAPPAWLDTWDGWGRALAVLALVFNTLQLLPLRPLDGQRAADIVLLGRWPWIGVVGHAGATVALTALAWALPMGPVALLVAAWALLLAWGLRQHVRQARVAVALRQSGRGAGQSRGSALRAIFDTLAQLGLGRLAWPRQKAVADALLPGLQRARSGRPVRLLGLVVYAGCLLLPVLGTLVWAVRLQHEQLSAAALQHADLEARAQADAVGRAQQAQWLRERQAQLQALLQRLANAGSVDAQWALLEPEMDATAAQLRREGPAALPAAQPLLEAATGLAAAPGATPLRRAQAALWQAEAAPAPEPQRQHLQAVMAEYAAAATRPPSDLRPLVRATRLWALLAAPEQRPEVEAQIDSVLARVPPAKRPQDFLALQTLRIEQLLSDRRNDEALALANGVFDRALPLGDVAYLGQSSRLLVDTTLAASGLAAALKVVDLALPHLDLARSPGQVPAESLRRFGLWLAEAAGQPQWQRTQVKKLAPPPSPPPPSNWRERVMQWLMQHLEREVVTLLDVDRAHWQGNEAAARQAARQLLQNDPGFAVLLRAALPGEGPLAAARATVLVDVRRAVYRRYGLPTAG